MSLFTKRSECTCICHQPGQNIIHIMACCQGKLITPKSPDMEQNNLEGKSIGFAYYTDGKFIGWYADTAGSVRKKYPKVYNYSEKQLDTIKSNITYKIKKIQESSGAVELAKAEGIGEALSTLIYDSEELLRDAKTIELKIVECPEYDGPNKDFYREISNNFKDMHTKQYHVWCKVYGLDPGIEEGTRFGIALIENYKRYEKTYPNPNPNTWIYADRQKVMEWALIEPINPVDFVKIVL